MTTKITLEIEQEVLNRIQEYAERTGQPIKSYVISLISKVGLDTIQNNSYK